MYRPITNCIYEHNEKSVICKLIEQNKKITTNELLCCNKKENSCSAYSSGCFEPEEVVQCHNLTALDACRRNDTLALQVCGGLRDSLFCLTAGAAVEDPQYTRLHFPEAIELMVSRNKLEESKEATFCNNQDRNYQLCNSTANPTTNFTCGDLFQGGCNQCTWKSSTGTIINRYIKTELCEPIAVDQMPTIIGLVTIVGVLVLILILFVAARVYKKLKIKNGVSITYLIVFVISNSKYN
ncbi:10434_t:CDS:1 [Funneliformis geosporum]|uniref:17221_t:CDS:1 n=1 Tax=Funneliformis geosporum TaxID=1117311 RepID=A0A9W4SPL6_9GLOM|nr:10434_t:CDS:1 [Funneliformis geosporum]CAI2176226.1 17221_t:CDS:1 [Funneliformis geosporum]